MRISRGALGKFLVTAGTFGNAIAQWFIVVLIARVSGPQEVGMYTSVIAFATPIYVAAAFALRDVYLSLSEHINWSAYLSLRAVALALGAVTLSLIGSLANWPTELTFAFILLKTLDSLCDLYYSRLQRENKLLQLGILLVANPFLTVLTVGFILSFGGQLQTAIFGSACVSAGILMLTLLTVKQAHLTRNSPVGSLPDSGWRGLFAAGFPVTLAQLLSSLLMYTPIFLLQPIASEATIGRYSAAAYLVVFGHLSGSAIATITIPSLRIMKEDQGFLKMRAKAFRLAGKVLSIGLGASLIAVWLGNQALSLVYGPLFTVSIPVLICLALGAAVAAPGYLGGTSLLIANRYWSQMLVSLLSLGCALFTGLSLLQTSIDPILVASISALLGNLVRTVALWIAAGRVQV